MPHRWQVQVREVAMPRRLRAGNPPSLGAFLRPRPDGQGVAMPRWLRAGNPPSLRADLRPRLGVATPRRLRVGNPPSSPPGNAPEGPRPGRRPADLEPASPGGSSVLSPLPGGAWGPPELGWRLEVWAREGALASPYCPSPPSGSRPGGRTAAPPAPGTLCSGGCKLDRGGLLTPHGLRSPPVRSSALARGPVHLGGQPSCNG